MIRHDHPPSLPPESAGLGSSATDGRKPLIQLFLQRTLSDVDQMRRNVPQLVAGDAAAWHEVRLAAQRATRMARSFELGVLGAFAAELAALTDEKFAGVALDAHFLLSTTTAIELIAIEGSRVSSELA